MPVLNFTEIPAATSGAARDAFELLARDFLSHYGYKIITGPDRGQDGGRDIIVEETRTGIGGETKVKWLVSCKHKAISGQSVTLSDEEDIVDRITSNRCQGFIGFYSTLPASSVTKKLEGISVANGIDINIFDHERIENDLLKSSEGIALASRYFPESIKKWKGENPRPVKLFETEEELKCDACGKNLLDPINGVVVFLENYDREERRSTGYVDIYFSCKGFCDRALAVVHRKPGLIDSWEDIPDISIPTVYLKWIMGLLNQQYAGITFQKNAFEKVKQLLIAIYPYVSRELTPEEKERLKNLMSIPAFLGGMGS